MGLNINKFGFVDWFHSDFCIKNIYSFVHWIDDPIFTHFNGQTNILDLKETEQSVSYMKPFNSIVDIMTHHQIINNTDQIEWTFQIDSDEEICFGISCPVSDDKIWLANNTIGYNIVNYSNMWIPPYVGQTNIDIPVVKVKISDASYVAIMTGFNHDVHFYNYHDNNQNYLKIGFKTTNTTSANVVFMNVDASTNLLDLYQQKYPASEHKINFWKVVFGKITKLYKIKIFFDCKLDKWGYRGDMPSMSNVIRYADILWQEFLKYPISFFDLISDLYLCENLTQGNDIYYAFSAGSHIGFNISSDVSEEVKRIAIHHELYHQIENNVTAEKLQLLSKKWCRARGESIMSDSQERELRAELYARIMLGYRTDDDCSDILKEFVNKLYPDMSFDKKYNPSDHQQIIHTSKYGVDVQTKAIEQLINKHGFYVDKQTKQTQLVITGFKGSGLNLLKQIFEDLNIFDHITSKYMDANIADQFDFNHSNIIYIVSHPLRVAAYHKDDQNVLHTIDVWKKIYRYLIEQHLPFIKYEDLVTGNQQAFSKLLTWIGVHEYYQANFNLIETDKIQQFDLTEHSVSDVEMKWFSY